MLSILLRQIAVLPVMHAWPSQSIVRGTERRGYGWVLLLLAFMAGCSSTSSKSGGAAAAPITMTNANGLTAPASELSLGSKLSLSMTPSNDVANLGVDWTVICGGNPVTGSITNGGCGTLAPAHTQGGGSTLYTAPSQVPVGTSVTITATVTSNPSQSTRASLTIVASPIGVAFTPTTVVPASLAVNTTLGLAVLVTNDPLGASVIWTASCGSGVCGSFSNLTGDDTVYAAPTAVPAGGTVTITATSQTDTTKSASVTVPVTLPPPPVPVSVIVLPSKVYVETTGSAHSTPLTALVGNDPAEAGVDWSLSCGASSCGTINGSTKGHTASGVSVTYASPSGASSGLAVTIMAKSTTNPAVSADATATVVTAVPIIVAISSAPAANITAGSQAVVSAKVTNDTNNLGVDWMASCGSAGACGSFSPAHTASGGQTTYTAPAAVPVGGVVTITATSSASTPSNPAVAFTTILAQPPSLTFSQQPPVSMVAATQVPVSATVANDVAPGGVTWSVQCGSTLPGGCGWISPVQAASGAIVTYTAPPVTSAGTSVTLTATSTADPGVSISSNAIAINPDTVLSVGFIPLLPAQVQTSATVNLMAAVKNDTTNAGVDWKVCPSSCGFFTIKPAIAEIPATDTTSYVPAVPAVTATSVSGWSNGLPIPYTSPSQIPSSGTVTVVASAHADATKANSGNVAITTNLTGPALNGVVQAGSQPVAGSSVSLYVAGTSGYASASRLIVSASTDTNGNFTVPAGYTCPTATSQMYLVAIGGKVGTNAANPNLSLMTTLGSCNALGSSTVVVNEVTTIASAWSTAPFAANDELTGNSSYLYLGTSSSNLYGLANAFATVNNLVDITTGKPRFMTPAANAAVPYVQINTLADFLSACTVTSGGVEGDGSPCSVLFTASDTLQRIYAGSIAPSDTLQAAFNIGQHPANSIGYGLDGDENLYTLATNTSPFQPAYSSTPNPVSWAISLNYTGGGGLTSVSTVGSLAVDVSGNLWITDSTAGSVIEWNTTGAALSPPTGFPAGGGPIAIDANGNVWTSANGVLNELTSLGTPVPGSPYIGVAEGGNDIAFDAQGNLWIANGAGVNEFNNLGMRLSPAAGFTYSGISGIGAVGIDSSNNVWTANANDPHTLLQPNFTEFTNPGGALIVSSLQTEGALLPQLAADGSGNIWGASSIDNGAGAVCKVPPYGGIGVVLVTTCYSAGLANPGDGGYTPFPLGARGLAFDGAAGLWVAGVEPAADGVSPSKDGVTLRDALGNYLQIVNSIPDPTVQSLRMAIDGSGNVWVLRTNNTVAEYITVATPVVAPVALGVKNKKLAAKP